MLAVLCPRQENTVFAGAAGKMCAVHTGFIFFRLPVIVIHLKMNVDKYEEIFTSSLLTSGKFKTWYRWITACQQMWWIVSGKLSCVLQYHLRSRLPGFVAVLSISYNFLGAHVLLTSLENWLLLQNNPISVIITFKWHSMVKTNRLCWQGLPSVHSWGISLPQKRPS